MKDLEFEESEITEREASARLDAIARLTTNRLDTEQMAILVLLSVTGGDPRPTKCWPVAEPLFSGTKEDVPYMHSEIARMVGLVAATQIKEAESREDLIA